MDAQERKTEILDLAQRLFFADGYDATPISRIIEETGIAKGTFYHHFKSKAELVEALIERQIAGLVPMYDAVLARSDMDPVAQLQACFDISITWKAGNVGLMVAMIQALYRDGNTVLRKKMTERNVEVFGPYINKVVTRGAELGVFCTPFPHRLGSFLLSVIAGVSDTQGQLIAALLEDTANIDEYEVFIQMVEHTINRLLGLPDGTVTVGGEAILEPLRAYVHERSSQ